MVTDAQRLDLYSGLVEGLGQGRADTLMQLLPGAGWADVARRSDLESLRADIGAKLAAFEGKLGVFEGKLGAFEGKLGAFEGDLGRLEGRLGRLEGRLYAAMAAQTVILVGLVNALT